MNDTARTATADEHDTWVATSAIDAEIKRLKAEREELLVPVREAMDTKGMNALSWDGANLFTLSEVVRHTLDEEGLLAEHPELILVIAKHTVQKITKRFTVGRVHRDARTAVAA